jgi:hypothetical protein
MNEFIVKKLGEVKAFIIISGEFYGRGREALEKVLDGAEMERVVRTITEQTERLEQLIDDLGEREIIDAKAMATAEKLRTMSEVYMKKEEDWADPAEVLEWLGFFEGAAAVHFHLASGAGRGLGLVDVSSFAEAAAEFHENFLDDVAAALSRYAEDKMAG